MQISQINGNEVVDTSKVTPVLLTYDGTSIKQGTETVTFATLSTLCANSKNEVKVLYEDGGLLLQLVAFDGTAIWFGAFYKLDNVWYINRIIMNSDNAIIFDDDALQDKLTFDTAPTSGSSNPVTSGGVYTAINSLTHLKILVVTELPTTGDTSTIYLVPKTGTATDSYDEYIYVNNKWEKIGSTDIDLSGYLTKTEASTTYQTKLTAGTGIDITDGTISVSFSNAEGQEV